MKGIVTLTPSDSAALSALHASSFDTAWSAETFSGWLSQDDYHAYGMKCENDSTLLGFVLIRTVLDEAEIITIATSPHRRKKGIATHIMRNMLQNAKHANITTLFLEVRESNKAAYALYKSLGFTITGQRAHYYPLPHGGVRTCHSNAFNSITPQHTALHPATC